MVDERALDNPVWTSLNEAHGHLAQIKGQAARFPSDVSAFAAFADDPSEGAWDDLAALVQPGETVGMIGRPPAAPPGWDVRDIPGVQLVDTSMRAEPLPEAVILGPADVPEVLDLVARTEPGPFAPRTIELGRLLGLRHDGALIAMAGERFRVPGWVEISAVCTDPAHRGQGLGTALVRAVAAGIRARGDTPFLHAAASNERAIRLYRRLGFTLRRETTFHGVTRRR
jgi:ribosomal protein S18 acetylase RimI-like enzyme